MIWITGLSGSGKTSLATEVERRLIAARLKAALIDGEAARLLVAPQLGYGRADREAVLRRIAGIAAAEAAAGATALIAAVSPYAALRRTFRAASPNYREIFANASLEECERRDPKGLYRRARAGEIADMIGIDEPYDADVTYDVAIDTGMLDITACADEAMTFLAQQRGGRA